MYKTYSLRALLALATLAVHAASQTTMVPFGCSYDNGIYSCDYRFALPLSGGSMVPVPQQLNIYNVDGILNDANLEDFSLVNTTLFDSNYDASLSLTCLQGGGKLELDATSFTHMSFYKSVHIYNCEFDSIPASAFISLGNMNYFGISGGIIKTAAPHAMAGMTVVRDLTSVDPKGELSITNVYFSAGSFQNDFIEDQNDLSILSMENVMIQTVENDLLTGKESMTTLHLDNNNFTSIPNGVFSGLKALSTLSMGGINWECSCTNLWWMTHATKNGIRITSETICASPSSYYGRRAASFHDSVCTSGLNCDGGNLPAMNLADVTCLTYLQLFIYILAIVAFLGLIALGYFWLKMRRQAGRNGGGGGEGGRRSSRVHNQNRNNPPNIKGGWS